jgi:DNA-binding CsgD family transcriptional regulator
MAEAVGDHSALARALMALGFIRQFPDPLGSRPTSERARDVARACGDDWAYMTSCLNLAFTHINRHEVDDAERQVDEILPLIKQHGYLEAQAWYWLGKFYRAWWAVDSVVLSDYPARALAFARAAGEPTTEALTHGILAHVEIARGQPEAALARMQATHARVMAAGAGLALGWTASWLALAQASLGDVAAACAALEPAVATGMDGGFVLGHATVNLADILRIAGNPAGAETRAREALAIGKRVGNPAVTSCANETLGRLAAGRAEWGHAEALLHEALTARIEHDLLIFMPQTFDALAEVAVGADSDVEAARTLGIAHRARADLGLERWAPDAPHVAQLEATLRARLGDHAYERAYGEGRDLPLDEAVIWIRGARGARKRPARGWESLTPTELRVVALVAEGLTNPAIGERMFISRGTVKAHLGHIFAKVDVASRAELAAEATRRAPVP